MNYIFLISGILIFDLLRLNTEKSKPGFTWAKFLNENGIPSLIAIILGICLILGKGITQQFIEIAVGIMTLQIPIYLLIGICADVIIKKIYVVFNPASQTAIGINKDADGGDDGPVVEPTNPNNPKPR